MSYAPEPPSRRVAPERIAPDTWLVHQVQEALGEPLHVYLNSMVITGDEPMILDTGTIANREALLEDVFGLVEPADVRWIYISHDDIDHTGNLAQVLELCPNATLVGTWSMVERNANALRFPLERMRWVNDGESFDAGDRRFRAVRPPVWDSPTTRGLLDERTGVYWAVDSFACPMPGEPVATVDDLDPEHWARGIEMFSHHAVAPWLGLADPARFAAHVQRIQDLGMTTIATAHSPLIPAHRIAEAFATTRDLPAADVPPAPGQALLDEIVAATSVAAA